MKIHKTKKKLNAAGAKVEGTSVGREECPTIVSSGLIGSMGDRRGPSQPLMLFDVHVALTGIFMQEANE